MEDCNKIIKGDYDHLPEEAFYMVGTLEEVVEKAKKLKDVSFIDFQMIMVK